MAVFPLQALAQYNISRSICTPATTTLLYAKIEQSMPGCAVSAMPILVLRTSGYAFGYLTLFQSMLDVMIWLQPTGARWVSTAAYAWCGWPVDRMVRSMRRRKRQTKRCASRPAPTPYERGGPLHSGRGLRCPACSQRPLQVRLYLLALRQWHVAQPLREQLRIRVYCLRTLTTLSSCTRCA